MLRPLVLPTTVLLVGALFLLLPPRATAQMIVAGPPTQAGRALTAWFGQHVPAKFQARGLFEVSALFDDAMDDYLHENDNSEGNARNDSEDDDEEIDGVFVDSPPQIFLRVPRSGDLDFDTFAHEYGHYVWFNLLTQGDRKRYEALYRKQKSAHRLITDYAAESVEEGFAEAFSADMNTPAALLRQDPLSARFLSEWPKER